MFRINAVILALMSFTGTLFAESADAMKAAAYECAAAGDHQCAFDRYATILETGSVSVEEGGYLTILGGHIEGSLIQSFGLLPAEDTREQSERIVAYLDRNSPETPFVYATALIVRALSCSEIGDVACYNESRGIFCERMNQLAMPLSAGKLREMFMPSLMKVAETCSESGS